MEVVIFAWFREGQDPGQERGHCEVVVVGALAQFLAFAQPTTVGSSRADGTSLMVAGARNQRYLHLDHAFL